MDGKVIEKERDSENRKEQISEVSQSRYDIDNDLLLDGNDLLLGYGTSEDEEEISEDEEEISEDEKVTIKQDDSKTFCEYLKDIKNMATETNSLAIWGRLDIEGRMICEKYKVKIKVIELLEEPVEESTGNRYVIQSERGEGDNVVYVVNHRRHFVPLLSKILSDITESQPVSREEILGIGEDSNQPNQKPLKERADKSTGKINSQNHKIVVKGIHTETSENTEQVFSKASEDMKGNSSEEILGTSGAIPANQPEQKVQHNTKASRAAVSQDHTDKKIPFPHQQEQKIQQEKINTSTSEPVNANTVITISRQQEQKAQQEEIQKKLNNNYRKEAIYVIATVITAIVFTASAIAAVFTQPMPLACFAGVALVVACICAYQLTQNHKDINELKSELEENSNLTFLEETGFKIYSLVDKVASKV